LAHCLIRDVGTFHNLIDFERLLAERRQDIFSIIQHDCPPTDHQRHRFSGFFTDDGPVEYRVSKFPDRAAMTSSLLNLVFPTRFFSLSFFCCSMSHSHAKPMVTITMAMKMAYSIIGTSLSYLIHNVQRLELRFRVSLNGVLMSSQGLI